MFARAGLDVHALDGFIGPVEEGSLPVVEILAPGFALDARGVYRGAVLYTFGHDGLNALGDDVKTFVEGGAVRAVDDATELPFGAQDLDACGDVEGLAVNSDADLQSARAPLRCTVAMVEDNGCSNRRCFCFVYPLFAGWVNGWT